MHCLTCYWREIIPRYFLFLSRLLIQVTPGNFWWDLLTKFNEKYLLCDTVVFYVKIEEALFTAFVCLLAWLRVNRRDLSHSGTQWRVFGVSLEPDMAMWGLILGSHFLSRLVIVISWSFINSSPFRLLILFSCFRYWVLPTLVQSSELREKQDFFPIHFPPLSLLRLLEVFPRITSYCKEKFSVYYTCE